MSVGTRLPRRTALALVSASDIESRFIHHGYTAKTGDPAETARRAWSKFWEDVDHIAEGKDHDGLFVAQDGDGTIWKFVFTFCENDFDMDVEHGLPNYKKAKLFCRHCRATNCAIWGQNPYPHSDHRPDARWRGQCKMSNDEFKHRFVRPHPITGRMAITANEGYVLRSPHRDSSARFCLCQARKKQAFFG